MAATKRRRNEPLAARMRALIGAATLASMSCWLASSQVVCDSQPNKAAASLQAATKQLAPPAKPTFQLSTAGKAAAANSRAAIVDFENIINSIELQHLRRFDSKKSKFDSGLDKVSLIDKQPEVGKLAAASKQVKPPSRHQTSAALYTRSEPLAPAMQSIILSHELGAHRTRQQAGSSQSSRRKTLEPTSNLSESSEDQRPSKGVRVLSNVASYINPLVANGNALAALLPDANLPLIASAIGKLHQQFSNNPTALGSASKGVIKESVLRKSARSLTSLASAPSNSADKKSLANNRDDQLSLRSGHKRDGFLSSLGDKALHAAMIKPSLSFSDFLSEPSAELVTANTINTPTSDATNAFAADKISIAKKGAKLSALGATFPVTRNNSLLSPAHVFQESFRNLLTLTQLPVLTSNSQQLPLYATLANAQFPNPLKSLISSNIANSNTNFNKKKYPFATFPQTSTTASPTAATPATSADPLSPAASSTSSATASVASPIPAALTLSEQKRKLAAEEVMRFAYILTKRLSGKNDPLKALAASGPSLNAVPPNKTFSQRSKNPLNSPNRQFLYYLRQLRHLLMGGPRLRLPNKKNQIRPRGVMWDMATDPSLAVTVFHLLESASVALPLG